MKLLKVKVTRPDGNTLFSALLQEPFTSSWELNSRIKEGKLYSWIPGVDEPVIGDYAIGLEEVEVE